MMKQTEASALREQTYRGTHLRDSRGVYAWRDEKFPSITTLLKVLDKPALVRWAPKMVAEHVADYVLRRVPEERIGWKEVQRYLGDVETLKQVPWAYAEKRRDIGSTLHDIAEQVAAGVPVNPAVFAEDIRPLVEGFMMFCDAEQPEFLAMETGCFNRSVGYACTLDTIMRLPRRERTMIVDYKCSQDSYPEHAIQLAGQRYGEFIGLRDGTEIPMMEVDGTGVLLIQPNGYKLVEWETSPADIDDIRALVRLYERNQRKLTYAVIDDQTEETH